MGSEFVHKADLSEIKQLSKELASNPELKEDTVRERIILPLLYLLGYNEDGSIVRSKTLEHPFLKVGSNKKIPIKLIPDYLLKISGSYACVLDAKSPNQSVNDENHIEQVYSYATHPEVRSTYFALCNGIELAIYRTNSSNVPILLFNIEEIDVFWEKLRSLISVSSFQQGKEANYYRQDNTSNVAKIDYLNRKLLPTLPVRKNAAKRHFGVHGYFTKQSWNVVAEYIRNFSSYGDLVLDPFGGSGVTAVEAMMNNRRAINIDINPFAVFLVEALIEPVDLGELADAFESITEKYKAKEPKTKEEIKKAISKYPQPKPLVLPKGSDVPTVDKLFSKKQLACLGFLKYLILKQKNKSIKKVLLLMFSGLVTRINLTYHNSKSSGTGDAAAFRYYRYRIAPSPTELDIIHTFTNRYKRVVKAKKEMEYFINEDTISNIKVIKGSATDLSFIENESVDYIYTDPPYGKKIPYLDLSIMWNAWLDLDVSDEDYDLEAIEGGEHNKSKKEYNELIAKSIEEMFRVLKYDRWLSFVFAHKDPEFWHLIIETAEKCGFEYAGAVAQKNGQTSFKKRQNPFTVLSGQLIINFKKVRSPRAILKANLGMQISEIIIQTVEGIIAKNDGATLEEINDELIIKGLELGFLDLLRKEYTDLTPLLLQSFDYNPDTEQFVLKANSKFASQIDIELRIKYYLISFLRRKSREGVNPNFDSIILEILPLLKNGTTPEDQTILSVLEDIAFKVENGGWKLKEEGNALF